MGEVVRAAFRHDNRSKQGGTVADLDNGYLRIANDIQDTICQLELGGHEFRVLMGIIRLTYGWNRPEDRITNSLIADKTGLPVKKVSVAVLALEARHVIKMRRIGQTRYIGVNTKLNHWVRVKPNCSRCVLSFACAPSIPVWDITVQPSPKIGMVITNNGDGIQPSPTIPENGDSYPRHGGTPSPEKGNTKDTLLKDNKKPYSSEPEKTQVQDGENDEELTGLELFQKRHPDAAICTPAGKQWGTAEDIIAVRWIHKLLKNIDDSIATPSWAQWANDIRLLRSSRSVTHRDICEVFKWANSDGFWCTNILSPSSLRRHWLTLRLQMGAGRTAKTDDIDFDNTNWAGGDSE